jgi:KUP system potassium uptake protein
VDFHIGFKVDTKINLYFREVLEDLVKSGEIKLVSGYNSMRKFEVAGDFKCVLIDRIMLRDFNLTNTENFILALHSLIRHISIPEVRALELDSPNTIVEQVPIIINQPLAKRITAVKYLKL